MRVALYFFSVAGAGGAERMMLRLAGELAARGHAVTILSLDAPGTDSFYPIPSGTDWIRLGHDPRPMGKLRRVRAIRRLLRGRRIDALVGFVMGGDKTLYAATLGLRTRLVAAERNDPVIYRDRLGAAKRAVYWGLFLLCRRILVQVPAYRDGYPAVLRSRIDCIPNPVDPAPRAAGSGRPPGGGVILNAGRLHEQKGQDLLIRAFALVADRYPGWTLRIVGEGPMRARLEAMVADLRLSDRVIFAGAVADMAAAYDGADLFAFPSRYEGFPNALAEAMAHGLPAVGLRRCQGAVYLLDGEPPAGLVVEGDTDADVAPLADGLDRLMGDPALRAALADRARARAADFAPDRVMDRWEEALRAAIQAR